MIIKTRLNLLIMAKGFICLMMVIIFGSISLQAQDSTKRKTINITSTFKPSLKNTAKLNFNADAPVIDTTRPDLKYNLPAQFLSLVYQPAGFPAEGTYATANSVIAPTWGLAGEVYPDQIIWRRLGSGPALARWVRSPACPF